MSHFHIKVRDGRRERGALATTFDKAQVERDIENEINSACMATIEQCDKNCFGSRA